MIIFIVFLIFINSVLLLKLFKQKKLMKRLLNSLEEKEIKLKEKIETSSTGQAKLETILSSMFEGVLVTNKDGEILIMNPSLRKLFLIDFSPEGKNFLEVIRNATIQDIIDKTLKEEKNLISKEVTFYSPEEKIFKVNCAPIIRDNLVEGAILVFHDITELRRLERIRQDFVANVSHELRTPLTSIKGYAETLLEGAIFDKKNAKDFVEIIYNDADRLAKLIDDLLDLSKIESGRLEMVFLPIDILEVIEKVVKILEPQAKKKSILINLNIPPDLPKVLADQNRISQVILNLLDNAIKYTPNEGKISIFANPKDNFVQVDVIDTGIGIPKEALPHIFERFYRVDKARSRELGGTGLGLSIVKHIILNHGGNVWVESELGRGSTFSFTLPKV
ncbi:MAG: cell wall metabolism sensor histidine kinase WalK [Candidatus Omnitrophica bacterium]|nr:cell wall metabolism sensor histidine kinase WalK [Candidatus Omnitrophota bacterium]